MAASSVPASPYGPPSLDEIIFYTDVIAIVRPISTEAGTLTRQDEHGQTIYSPMVQFRYEVVEYLKGEGESEIVVNTNNFGTSTTSAEQALQSAESDLAAQVSKLDGGEGVVFLRRAEYPDEISDISRKENEIGWRQYNAQSGLFSAAEGISAASTSHVTSVAGSVQYEGFSVADLRERIEAMKSLLEEGEGIEGWEECIESRLLFENFRRKNASFLTAISDVATFPSGLPVDSIVDEFSRRYPDRWFSGENAFLFHYSNYKLRTMRPIPVGMYELQAQYQKSEWIPCDYVSPSVIWRYTFEAPAGTLHEAFFDPVDIADAVGADGTNGVLKPASFAVEDVGDVSISSLRWDSGQARMRLSPLASLSGHHIDFIELDGTVGLRLDFDDAVEVDDGGRRALSWGVCEQPWEAGDLLMLRIWSSAPADGVQATSNPECLAVAPAPDATPTQTAEPIAANTPTPEPTVTPTETTVPQPTTTATPSLTSLCQ